jgi:hypothetical protein
VLKERELYDEYAPFNMAMFRVDRVCTKHIYGHHIIYSSYSVVSPSQELTKPMPDISVVAHILLLIIINHFTKLQRISFQVGNKESFIYLDCFYIV